MKRLIKAPEGRKEFWLDEGCWITELLNDPAEPNVSIARARVEKGNTTRWHQLDGAAERYVIEAGEGIAFVGDDQFKLCAGDSVVIPAGINQRITNSGKGDLVFLCVCTPRFEPWRYVDTQEDHNSSAPTPTTT